MARLTPLEPANTVINLCGGFKAVADMVDRDETRVRRWTYPKSHGGTDGLIPSDMQVKLMEAARAAGRPLRPEHFFRDAAAVDHEPATGDEVRKPQAPAEDAA